MRSPTRLNKDPEPVDAEDANRLGQVALSSKQVVVCGRICGVGTEHDTVHRSRRALLGSVVFDDAMHEHREVRASAASTASTASTAAYADVATALTHVTGSAAC